MSRPGLEPLVRSLLVLAPAVLAGVLAVQAGWFGGTGHPSAVVGGGTAASARATVPTAGLPSPEALDEVVRALLAAMTGDGADLFSGAPAELPPALRTFFRESGADLLLGVAVADVGGTVTVATVFPGAPAERAGLEAGDVITALDDVPIASGSELRAAVEAVEPGTTYALTLRRVGAVEAVEIVREAPPGGDAWRAELLRTLALGLMLADRPSGPALPPSLLGELVEETPDGLRVFAVFPGSPADQAGLRPGDLLIAVDGHELSTLADVRSVTRLPFPASGDIEVTLERDGERMTLLVGFAVGGMFGQPSES